MEGIGDWWIGEPVDWWTWRIDRSTPRVDGSMRFQAKDERMVLYFKIHRSLHGSRQGAALFSTSIVQ